MMPYPLARDPIACAMSPMRAPARAAWMPDSSAASVVLIRRSAWPLAAPTATVKAASETKPRYVTPRSMLTMSPSLSTRSLGIPCTSSSFTEKQIAPG